MHPSHLPAPQSAVQPRPEAQRLSQISGQQWKSGIAAWLGWMFDGLDMHLYTLVAVPFVAQLLAADRQDPGVGLHASIIQAGFLIGWALGGGFFGRIGDRLGRSRALSLTILTYAIFTGMSFFAQTWWHLLIFRFLSALGVGGEWAVGASLLSETWPRRWRSWIAAVLQTGVNVGVILAVFSNYALAGPVSKQPRWLFLVGVLPALLVFWIRRAVPEPEEWHAAKTRAAHHEPKPRELFHGDVRRITILVIVVCALSLTAHWAFMFWHQVHLRNLPDVLTLTDLQRSHLASRALFIVIFSSILGNFAAGWVARYLGYRKTIALFCVGYFAAMSITYLVNRPYPELLWWLAAPGFFQGLFALFTMYLPPLFPTLLRTTGAGFCYNIGRIFAGLGTIFFGLFSYKAAVGAVAAQLDYRVTLLYAGFLFLPAGMIALFLPDFKDTDS